MKISPKFVIKVAGTLTVIALVTAALLGLVDGVTRDKIAEIEAEKTRPHVIKCPHCGYSNSVIGTVGKCTHCKNNIEWHKK